MPPLLHCQIKISKHFNVTTLQPFIPGIINDRITDPVNGVIRWGCWGSS